jgi:hypothetical protein
MSADVWIETPPCGKCGSRGPERVEVNITYNLSPMLAEAGFVGWFALVGMPARKAGRHLLRVLEEMADEPLRWRDRNPENGWGDYDGCLQNRLRKFATQCVIAPKRSTIGGSL